MRARVAWILVGLSAAMTITDVLVTSAYQPLFSEKSVAQHGFPFVNGAVLLSALLGAVIISRDDRHVVGWLLSVVGVTSALSLVLETYSIWVVSEHGPGSREVAGVLGLSSAVIGGQFAIGGLALLFLVAPDGRLLSRRWWLVAAVVPLGEVSCIVALLSADPTTYDIRAADAGPLRAVPFTVGFTLIALGLLGALVSMLVRLGRSRGEERQQVRLIALAAGLMVGALVLLAVLEPANGGTQTWAASVPLFVSYLLLPVLFAVAVLRYRLYDIDLFINRAVVLAIGTVFAAGGYTTLVVLVGSQLDTRTGGLGISLAGTVVVALAFQPLRRWVVAFANRLAYGPRARPYIALSDFSRRLAETPTPDTLLPAVADAAGRAVSARGATVTLDVQGIGIVSSAWGDGASDVTTPYDVPIRIGGSALGHITVFVPKGRSIRAADANLLHALADQAAVAFRNTAMETELAERVADLDRTTHELVESRARVIAADDTARRALETAITREVLPQLVAIPARLGDARVAVAAGSQRNGLEEMVDSTNSALEALRELTRGIFPTQLARSGLEPALRSRLARSGLAGNFRAVRGGTGQRFSARAESAIYFCCAESVGAMSAHSSIELDGAGQVLRLRITGINAEDLDLQAVGDRIAAADGSLTIEDDQLTVLIPEALAVAAAVTGGGGPGL